ncbi:MAG: GDP-L-fucose synthase family protein [Burkholderiales bacterium]
MRIYVAGHRGMAGSAIVRRLRAAGYDEIIIRSRDELDLTNQRAVFEFLARERPDYVFLAAAKVGGIHANASRPAEFLYQNLAIEANLIHGAWRAGVQRLLFLGSSCIYPRDCPQPIEERYLLGGPLEATNEPYAIAKIAGLKLCEAYNRQYGTRYVVVMPTNLYGPNDNYDLETSHVAAALLRKTHEAKLARREELVVWGTGNPRREFLHVDDLADACIFLMERGYDGPLVNVGTGEDLPIRELAALIMRVVGLEARLRFDPTKPDGTPRKLLDVRRLHGLGWHARIPLAEGLRATYDDFSALYGGVTASATATT